MLVRFRPDVVALRPRVVVIATATMSQAPPDSQPRDRHGQHRADVDIVKTNGIRVVLASVTPVCDCVTGRPAQRS
jgi:hypothetical protein